MTENKQIRDIRDYFSVKVNPIFEPLLYNLVKQRPQDLVEFCIQYFKQNNKVNNQQSDDSENDEQSEDVPADQFEMWRIKRITNKTRKIRTAICTQVYGPFNKRNVIVLRKGESKDQNIQMKILFLFMNSFLFSHFNQEQKKLLIDNMSQKKVLPGERIIIQGQYGDQIYFIVSGQYQCYQSNMNGRRILKVYKSGDIFGQLCILQNSTRLTTIEAKTQGFLYCLDRQVYRQIKKLSIVKKRTLYDQTIKKIKIFENCEKQQLQKIFDCFIEVTYETGKVVINQGDIGNKFYIVLEGVLAAYKGKSQNVSQCFKQGDYFGEVALVNDTPRQATVKTITKCTLVYLTQDVFKRMVNKQKIQKQIVQKYTKKKNILTKRRVE